MLKIVVLVAAIAITIFLIVKYVLHPPSHFKVARKSVANARVTNIIDGDTIVLETGEKVRYVGMDTPELHHPKKPVQCFAQKAMERNRELILGKVVRLEKDVSETDKYGRLLRYVFIDNLLVNDELVKEGYAQLLTIPPDVKYANLFRTSQQEAFVNGRGLWKECK